MYIEYLYLTDWAVNSTALMLAMSFAKRKTPATDVLLGAAFIAAETFFSFEEPLINSGLRLVFALFGTRFATIEEPPAATLGVFFLFVLFSAAINGAAYALSVKFSALRKTFFSATVVTAIIVVASIAELLSSLIYERKKITDYLYDIKIMSKEGETKTQAFYDSGNTMTENGVPVVFLSRKFAQKIGILPQKSLFVSTVAGIKRLRASPMKIDVYFAGGTHKVYETFGAIAETQVKADVILHSTMRED